MSRRAEECIVISKRESCLSIFAFNISVCVRARACKRGVRRIGQMEREESRFERTGVRVRIFEFRGGFWNFGFI